MTVFKAIKEIKDIMKIKTIQSSRTRPDTPEYQVFHRHQSSRVWWTSRSWWKLHSWRTPWISLTVWSRTSQTSWVSQLTDNIVIKGNMGVTESWIMRTHGSRGNPWVPDSDCAVAHDADSDSAARRLHTLHLYLNISHAMLLWARTKFQEKNLVTMSLYTTSIQNIIFLEPLFFCLIIPDNQKRFFPATDVQYETMKTDKPSRYFAEQMHLAAHLYSCTGAALQSIHCGWPPHESHTCINIFKGTVSRDSQFYGP